MKFMYTDKPDDLCHDFGDGLYGRPVNTCHQSSKRKLGWTFDKSEFKAEEKAEEKADDGPTRDEIAESLGIALYDEDGKKRHYRLIQGDIDEHNESQTS